MSSEDNVKTIQYVKPKTKGQEEYIRCIAECDITLCYGCSGTGKAQPLYSNILTPTGWKSMGDIKIGDEICSVDGEKSKVIYISPQTLQEVYRVYFKDGSYTDCSKDHLWNIYFSKKNSTLSGWNTLQLSDFKDKLETTTYKGKFGTPIAQNIEFTPIKELSINPYILGVLIGDGCLTVRPTFTSADNELVENISELVKEYGCKVTNVSDAISFSIVAEKHNNQKNNIWLKLIELDMIGKRSYEKSIPKEYLFASRKDRLALIQGLMDTDGTVGKTQHVSYCTTSPQLAKDMEFLLRSIGALTYTSIKKPWYYNNKKEKVFCKQSYIINIRYSNSKELFRLHRKQKLVNENYQYKNNLFRRIDRVEKLPDDICQCIAVSHPSQLYITDNFIVTHNTHIAASLACQYLKEGKIDKILISRPIVANSVKTLGALPGDIREKIDPYLLPIMEEMKKYLGNKSEVGKLISDKVIELVPLELIRGRTFDNCFMILDESQNCSFEQLKCFLTRIGQGSKIVINGDTDQTDLTKDAGGFQRCIDLLDGVTGIGVVELTQADIVRNPLIKRILGALG